MADTLTNVRVLLDDVRGLKEAAAVQSLSAATRLLQSCMELRRHSLAESRASPEYNLFRLLGLEYSEVGLHTPFLTDLLDPYGSHGQGGLFLRGFLRSLAAHDSLFTNLAQRVEDAPQPGEWLVLLERERIDVSIRNRRLGLLLFIENKIYAGEQDQQLARYRGLLDRQSAAYRQRFLIFLAPMRYGAPASGQPDICLSYEADILRWLDEDLGAVQSTRVRAGIEQYVEIIRTLSGGRDVLPR